MPSPIVNSVTISNSALIKVGADIIQSLSQSTRSATIINSIYEYLRDEVLRSRKWRFATKRVALTANSTSPAFDYTYAYDIPNDCLKVQRLDLQLGDSDYIIENGQILTNESSPLNVVYTYRNTDESSWSAMFAECFAWRIAQEIAYSLTQSSECAMRCEKGYNNALAQAASADGSEGRIQDLQADVWTQARRGWTQTRIDKL